MNKKQKVDLAEIWFDEAPRETQTKAFLGLIERLIEIEEIGVFEPEDIDGPIPAPYWRSCGERIA